MHLFLQEAIINWKSCALAVLRNLLLAVGGPVIVLAVLGYFLAGVEGLQNGAIWGLVLGLIAWPLSSMAILYKYWQAAAGEIGPRDTWGGPWGQH